MIEIQTNHDDCNIERCTANDNFSIIPNEILQHPTMSANATMVLIYLLSCKSDWVIKPKNVWKAKNMSRDQVYAAFDELIDLGYMDRQTTMLGNLKSSVKYKVSYLKKFLRRSDIQDTESRDTENQDALIRNIPKKNHKEKRNNNKTPKKEASPVVVFSIFNELEIPEEMKERLSAQMDEDKASKLVERVKLWSGRLSDAIACNTILKQWDSWIDNVAVEDVGKVNKEWALKNLKKYEVKRGLFRNDQFDILNSGVEYSMVGGQPICFGYDSRSFQSDVADFVKKQFDY